MCNCAHGLLLWWTGHAVQEQWPLRKHGAVGQTLPREEWWHSWITGCSLLYWTTFCKGWAQNAVWIKSGRIPRKIECALRAEGITFFISFQARGWQEAADVGGHSIRLTELVVLLHLTGLHCTHFRWCHVQLAGLNEGRWHASHVAVARMKWKHRLPSEAGYLFTTCYLSLCHATPTLNFKEHLALFDKVADIVNC